MTDETKFVAYPADENKGKKAHIDRMYVVCHGDVAFVRKTKESKRAEVVSSASVFSRKEEAQEYLAEGGQLRWVVCTIKDKGFVVPILFQARVLFSTYVGRYRPERDLIIVRVMDGEIVKPEWGSTSIHTTKKEAEKAFGKVWRGLQYDLVKQRNVYERHLAILQGYKPRSRKAKS